MIPRNAAVWLLVALAALQGATSRRSRRRCARCGSSCRRETLESAFAFDAIQLELVFVVGPLIAAGLATALSPAVGMFLCAGFYLVASVGFATAPAARARRRRRAERTRAGALRSPGMRTLVFAAPSPRSRSGRSRWRCPRSPRPRVARGGGPAHHRVGARVGDRGPLVRRALLDSLRREALPDPDGAARPGLGAAAIRSVDRRDGRAAAAHRLRAGAARHHRVRAGGRAGAPRHPDRGLLVADRRERDRRSGRLADRRPARRTGERRVGARHRRHRLRGRSGGRGGRAALAAPRGPGRYRRPRRRRAAPAPRPAWRACAGQPPRSGECAHA